MIAALIALTLAAAPLAAAGPASAAASSPAPAPASPAVALARKVQTFYERTQDLEAGFVQKYTYAVGGRSQTSRGTLRVKKPGKLRWDYAEPSQKTIVVNGSRLTQYEPEESQAYVDEHFDASAMSAAVTFLLGKGSLEKEFHLAADGADKLVLTPKKPDARVEKVVLTVGEDGGVTATQVTDGSGNVNDIAFEHLQRNPKLADGLFVLDLPKDVHFVKAPGGR